jgi:predicted PurR-regulated permease PerM
MARARGAVGSGIVSSIFALVTILVMSMFMVARGRVWREAFLRTRPQRQAEALGRAFDNMAYAVGAYIRGALLQAFIAGLAAFLMLVIPGVGSPLALATIIMVLDLIPLVGATIGAVIVGVATARRHAARHHRSAAGDPVRGGDPDRRDRVVRIPARDRIAG